ncbi:hypothetical protein DW184_13880 [Enterobacter cloacae]|nr:hypothetical protein DW184_13880 [Enterobacter cloacae]RTQ03193.1 hypothetical protein EKN38_06940 [Enterobacter sp. WCHEn045836]
MAQGVSGCSSVIPYFFTTISTEKVNKIALVAAYLFITLRIFVSYSNVIRLQACKRVVYRLPVV